MYSGPFGSVSNLLVQPMDKYAYGSTAAVRTGDILTGQQCAAPWFERGRRGHLQTASLEMLR